MQVLVDVLELNTRERVTKVIQLNRTRDDITGSRCMCVV
jgi:hypothetical protein